MYNQYDLYCLTSRYPNFYKSTASNELLYLDLKKPSFLIKEQNQTQKYRFMKSASKVDKKWRLSPQTQHKIQMIDRNPFLKTSHVHLKQSTMPKPEQPSWSYSRQNDDTSRITKESIIGELLSQFRQEAAPKNYEQEISGQFYNVIGKYVNETKPYPQPSNPLLDNVIKSEVISHKIPISSLKDCKSYREETIEYPTSLQYNEDNPQRVNKTANKGFILDESNGSNNRDRTYQRPENPLEIFARQTPSIINIAGKSAYDYTRQQKNNREIASSEVNQVYKGYHRQTYNAGTGIDQDDPIHMRKKESSEKYPETINVKGQHFYQVMLS